MSIFDREKGIDMVSLGQRIRKTVDEEFDKKFQAHSAHSANSVELRERICMALIGSPQPIADMIMAAKAVEEYITGPESAPKAAVSKPVKQENPVLLQEGITALIEARFPYVKVTGMVVNEPGVKSMSDPFGFEGAVIINLRLK